VTLDENLSYAGAFSAGGGSTLSLIGGYLNLTGKASFTNGTVNGSQRLYVRGTTTISSLTIGGAAVFENVKSVTQLGGKVTVGDGGSSAATLYNFTGATYAIADNSSIAQGAATGSHIINAGLFEKTGGTGLSEILPAVQNTGTIEVASGTLDLKGAITGGGSLTIEGATRLRLDSTVAGGQTASFAGSGGELILGDAQGFGGKIAGFGVHDELVFGAPFTAGTVASFVENAGNTQGLLTLSDGSAHASLTLLGSYVSADFHAISSASGTLLTYTPPEQGAAALFAAHG
jgi:hypothetical protein